MKFITALKTALGMAPGCEQVNEFLAEYVEGTLDEKMRAQFQEHMDMCKCCDHYLDQYRHTIQLTKEIDEISVPSELAEHTLAFLRKSNAFASDQDAASS
ncbi:MAG: anti-sigma factor family protein [Rhodothermales bacterium]